MPESKSASINVVHDTYTKKNCDLPDTPIIINNYFSTIGENLDSKIPQSCDPGTRTSQVCELILNRDIPVSLVIEFLRDLNTTKPSGCLQLSSKLYILAFSCLHEQLAYLFNFFKPITFQQPENKNNYPDSKKGDLTQLGNIRPISITHISVASCLKKI